MRCIFCGSPDFKVLGNLGNRRHYRCNLCGLEWNRRIEQIENNKANEDYLRGLPKKWWLRIAALFVISAFVSSAFIIVFYHIFISWFLLDICRIFFVILFFVRATRLFFACLLISTYLLSIWIVCPFACCCFFRISWLYVYIINTIYARTLASWSTKVVLFLALELSVVIYIWLTFLFWYLSIRSIISITHACCTRLSIDTVLCHAVKSFIITLFTWITYIQAIVVAWIIIPPLV